MIGNIYRSTQYNSKKKGIFKVLKVWPRAFYVFTITVDVHTTSKSLYRDFKTSKCILVDLKMKM